MTNTFNSRALGVILAGAAAFACAHPAGAQTTDEPPRVLVNYADLDINHAKGAAVLLQRIRSAAATACGGQSDLHLLAERMWFDHCRKTAVDQSVKSVHSPRLTALAAGVSTDMVIASTR